MELGKDLKWIFANEEFCDDSFSNVFVVRSSEAVAQFKHIKDISVWVKDNEILSDDLSDFVVSSTELGTYISDMYR